VSALMSAPDHTPLHVAFDVGPLYGHRTGVGEAVDGMLAGLRRREDVDVLPYLVSFRSSPDTGHRKLPLPGIVASHLWSRTGRPRADRWLTGADLVHGTNYVAPPTTLPTVVSVYDCWFLAHPELASALVRRAGENLRRAVARGAWVHTSSEATAHQARTLLGTDRVVAIHLGPPTPVTPTPTAPESAEPFTGRPFVLAIGTEEHRKDLPLLVRAFERLAADGEVDAHLVLAGAPGDATADLDAAIAALPNGTAERVHRLGVVDLAAKQWLLRQAAVLAYPSLDEGFGFPILEAQAAGTPVVASEVGSVPEVGGDGIVLVADRTPERFADALHDVMTGAIGRLRLIEAGHRNVRRFSWSATAEQLADLYRSAVEAGTWT
jgi:glycosyltransferase involved in cell wall biosynthesis